MTAPIDILPPELLSHIFITATQSWLFALSWGDESYGGIHYPTVFSSVSTRWRRIAIGTPSLWSYIYLSRARYTLKNPQHVNLYLERSGDLPLSVCIGRYVKEYTLKTVDEKLASLLHSLTMRLECVAIASYDHSYAGEILTNLIAGGAAGRVRKLALYAHSRGPVVVPGPQLSQENLDRFLQPLRSLYLETVFFDWSTIACRNLVDLQIMQTPVNERPILPQLIRFLNANPAIRRLRLPGFDPDSYDDSEFQRITLLELRRLELDLAPHVMQAFLKSLNPVPQELDLELCSYTVPYLEDFDDLLSQLFQKNRIVFLHAAGHNWFPFWRALIHLPHLETIRIHESCLINRSLDGTNDHRAFLPKLKNVELVGTRIYEEECLGALISLPSVKRILLCYGDSRDQENTLKDVTQVREWLDRLGVTSSVGDASRAQWFSYSSPFM
ncbi:hypothetical protein BDV93DRAFT_521038 [Ceratobasidium sp. AG-I]|nr:hypothetical protein BDV93DRAFT_521038 [Ceratobasidium sp. AG-I]